MKKVFRNSEKGQAATEFGVILPAMIILILAVVVYGRPYYFKLAAQNIAYSACSAVSRSSLMDAYNGDAESQFVAGSIKGVGNNYALNYGANGLARGNGNASSLTIHSIEGCMAKLGERVEGHIRTLYFTSTRGVAAFFPSPFLSREYGE